MDSGLEQLSVFFSTIAQKLFISTYEKFRLSTKKLDRLKDENVFQLQLAKYLNSLKWQLDSIAYEIVTGNKTIKNMGHCKKIFGDTITIYLREFQQKARLL